MKYVKWEDRAVIYSREQFNPVENFNKFFLLQVLWDGKWVEGTGRSTGEETEQVFSFLSRFSNTTKYQRPESRVFSFYLIYIL